MSSKVINSICGGGNGGSTRPNFSVNNYSEEKTTAGSTNEIQVYPVNTMNSWKIQDTEPSNPALNDVWIKTGTGRYEFQPISGTNLTVPVSGASVWNGSSWDSKSTKCYYDGAWNPSSSLVYYYNNGVEYYPIETVNPTYTTLTKNSTYFKVETKTTSGSTYSGVRLLNVANFIGDKIKVNYRKSSTTNLTDYTLYVTGYVGSQGYSMGSTALMNSSSSVALTMNLYRGSYSFTSYKIEIMGSGMNAGSWFEIYLIKNGGEE